MEVTTTTTHCDVFRSTTKEIKKYRVELTEVVAQDHGEGEDVSHDPAFCHIDRVIDLCPKAYDRLSNFIMKGLQSPPGKKRPKKNGRFPVAPEKEVAAAG